MVQKLSVLALFVLSLIMFSAVRIYDGVQFDIHCGDYQKRAADSNNIELAEANLAIVIDYAKANGLTDGNTGVLWSAPEWDVQFWYQNVSASLADVRRVRANEHSSDLERSNVLMKLEKTMLIGSGGEINVPDGISIFPANSFFFYWLWISVIGFVISGIFVLIELDTL